MRNAPPQTKEEVIGEAAWRGEAMHFSDSEKELLTEDGLSLAPPSPSEWSALGMSPPEPPMPATSTKEKNTKEFKLGQLLVETTEHNAAVRGDASTILPGPDLWR